VAAPLLAMINIANGHAPGDLHVETRVGNLQSDEVSTSPVSMAGRCAPSDWFGSTLAGGRGIRTSGPKSKEDQPFRAAIWVSGCRLRRMGLILDRDNGDLEWKS